MSRAGHTAVVVGAGPVGIACALALRKHVPAVGLLDRRALPSESIDAAFDHRVYALSPASRTLLMATHRRRPLDADRPYASL
jgi:2-polyprenyl-6-methoxyphenol hydroxylase-like FAD-dependent oxidoreductase